MDMSRFSHIKLMVLSYVDYYYRQWQQRSSRTMSKMYRISGTRQIVDTLTNFSTVRYYYYYDSNVNM